MTRKLFSLLAFLILWQLLSYFYNSTLFPGPVPVAFAISGLISSGLLFQHIYASLVRVFIGFIIAVLTAVPLGLLMGLSREARDLIEPIVEIMRPIPPLAWIPIALLWFGIGLKNQAFIIFLGAFFPIVSNTLHGVESVEKRYVESASLLGASDAEIVKDIIMPSALPSIFTGLRIGIGVAWMCLVASELQGLKSPYGLGYMMVVANQIGKADVILAGIITIGVIGYALVRVISLVEERVVVWR